MATTQKNNLDTLLGLLNTTFEGYRKLVELNLQTLKSTLVESQGAVREVLSSKDPQEMTTVYSRLMQPAADKIQSYNRQVVGIVATTQAEIAKAAEVQYETHNRRVQMLLEDLGRSAPTGSEAAVAALKSTITATNTLCETLQRATRQAVDVAESNFHEATAAASKAS